MLKLYPRKWTPKTQKMYDIFWAYPVFGHAFDMIFSHVHGLTHYVDIDNHLDL